MFKNFKILELKGKKSLDLCYIYSIFFNFHKDILEQKGFKLDFSKNWKEFKEICYSQIFLYQFSDQELNLILSFFVDKNKIELDLNDVNPLEIKEFIVFLFDKIEEIKIYEPIYSKSEFTFSDEEIVEILVKKYGSDFPIDEFLKIKAG